LYSGCREYSGPTRIADRLCKATILLPDADGKAFDGDDLLFVISRLESWCSKSLRESAGLACIRAPLSFVLIRRAELFCIVRYSPLQLGELCHVLSERLRVCGFLALRKDGEVSRAQADVNFAGYPGFRAYYVIAQHR
jgi:hypothetical protein